MINLTNYVEANVPSKTRTILTCYVRLDKKTMLNILQSDGIYINGENFKVPEHKILSCLINGDFGETKLELENIGVVRLSFDELKDKVLKHKAKSEYKQASIVILRNIFEEYEAN